MKYSLTYYQSVKYAKTSKNLIFRPPSHHKSLPAIAQPPHIIYIINRNSASPATHKTEKHATKTTTAMHEKPQKTHFSCKNRKMLLTLHRKNCQTHLRSTTPAARMVESVDTRDLKSLGHCGCVGSSPTPSTGQGTSQAKSPVFFITNLDKKNITTHYKIH